MIKSDSWTSVQILNGVLDVLWSVTMVVNFVRALMSAISIRVVHSLWEENNLIDYFTNLDINFVGEFQFNNVEEFPTIGRKIINLDKIGIPNIRKTI